MGLAEWLGTRSQSSCLGFDQELPSSSLGTNTLKKLPGPVIYPAMGPPVANSDQSLVESFEETLWETKKKKKVYQKKEVLICMRYHILYANLFFLQKKRFSLSPQNKEIIIRTSQTRVRLHHLRLPPLFCNKCSIQIIFHAHTHTCSVQCIGLKL